MGLPAFVTLPKMGKLFYKVVVSLYILSSKVPGLQLLHAFPIEYSFTRSRSQAHAVLAPCGLHVCFLATRVFVHV